MRLLATIGQKWLRHGAPRFCGNLTRLLYQQHNVTIGPAFGADGVPRCLVDTSATLRIHENVEFRQGVELRVHGKATLEIEPGVRIDRGVRILAANSAHVHIRSGARIGLYSVLNGGDSITVGANSLISGFVYLQTSMHRFEAADRPIKDQHYTHGPVSIGEGAWIAAHVVVMPGITIGTNAVVGSNAVVTRDVADFAVVGGIPAIELRRRDSFEQDEDA